MNKTHGRKLNGKLSYVNMYREVVWFRLLFNIIISFTSCNTPIISPDNSKNVMEYTQSWDILWGFISSCTDSIDQWPYTCGTYYKYNRYTSSICIRCSFIRRTRQKRLYLFRSDYHYPWSNTICMIWRINNLVFHHRRPLG